MIQEQEKAKSFTIKLPTTPEEIAKDKARYEKWLRKISKPGPKLTFDGKKWKEDKL